MKKPFLIVFALVCAIVGCKIDEAGLPTRSNNPLLIGTWYMKASTTTDPIFGSNTSTDYNSKDYYQFNSDYTIKASSSFPDTVAYGRYNYVNNASGQQVTIGDAGGTTTYTVNKLTTDSLIMAFTITVTAGSATTYIPGVYKFARK